MLSLLRDPIALTSIAAGLAGLLLLAHARMQSKLLRHRISTGEGTDVIDPQTGLFAAATMHQCVRAEANRAARLGHALDVWIALLPAEDGSEVDARALALDLPAGTTGVRVDDSRVCVLSCVGAAADPTIGRPDLAWHHSSIDPSDEMSQDALAFIEEAAHA